MKKKIQPQITEKKNNKREILMGIIPSLVALLLFGLSFIIPSIPEKMKLTVMLLIYFCLTLIVFILSLFRSPNKFTMSWALPLVMFTLFMGSDSVWQRGLLWNKNYLVIYSINTLIILFFIVVLFHSNKIRIKSLIEELKQKPEPLYEKIISVLAVFLFVGATWWIINQIICTAAYYLPQKEAHYTAEVTSTGSTRGKYYWHRYWNMKLSNGKKKFSGFTRLPIRKQDINAVLPQILNPVQYYI